MTQPTARERVESMIRTNRSSTTVWSAPEVKYALDAYRDDIAIDIGRDVLRDGLQPFLVRLVGEPNAKRLLDEHRAAVLDEAADVAERLMDELYGPDCAYAIGGRDVATKLRRMAEEARS